MMNVVVTENLFTFDYEYDIILIDGYCVNNTPYIEYFNHTRIYSHMRIAEKNNSRFYGSLSEYVFSRFSTELFLEIIKKKLSRQEPYDILISIYEKLRPRKDKIEFENIWYNVFFGDDVMFGYMLDTLKLLKQEIKEKNYNANNISKENLWQALKIVKERHKNNAK